MNTREIFSRRLSQAMAEKGISIKNLARMTDLHESEICRYRHGGLPGVERAVKIVRALGVSLDWLCVVID